MSNTIKLLHPYSFFFHNSNCLIITLWSIHTTRSLKSALHHTQSTVSTTLPQHLLKITLNKSQRQHPLTSTIHTTFVATTTIAWINYTKNLSPPYMSYIKSIHKLSSLQLPPNTHYLHKLKTQTKTHTPYKCPKFGHLCTSPPSKITNSNHLHKSSILLY